MDLVKKGKIGDKDKGDQWQWVEKDTGNALPTGKVDTSDPKNPKWIKSDGTLHSDAKGNPIIVELAPYPDMTDLPELKTLIKQTPRYSTLVESVEDGQLNFGDATWDSFGRNLTKALKDNRTSIIVGTTIHGSTGALQYATAGRFHAEQYLKLTKPTPPVNNADCPDPNYQVKLDQYNRDLAAYNEDQLRKSNFAPHWSVLTGISTEWDRDDTIGRDYTSNSPWKWLRLYNPFNNQTEYYWWGDIRNVFTSDWNHSTLVIRLKK